jgi:hypothetical protein
MNFFGSNGARLSLGLGGQEPPRFRLNRSLLSLIGSLHKSPCLEPAPTDRSLNRAPTEARVRTADVVESQKIEPAEQAAAKREKKKRSQKNLLKQLHVGSAPLHWFKLTAGINGILPASGGPLPFIPLLA